MGVAWVVDLGCGVSPAKRAWRPLRRADFILPVFCCALSHRCIPRLGRCGMQPRIMKG